MPSSEPPPLPEDALEERFLAATGPGGQNVNKVATAVQLRVDVFRLGLAPFAYQRLKELAGSKLTAGGELLITARRFRTQDANRADARTRIAALIARSRLSDRMASSFAELIARAHVRQAKRVKTKPSKAARAKRVDEKKGRSAVKARRGPVKVE